MTDPRDLIRELLSWSAAFAEAGWTVDAAVRQLGPESSSQDQYGLRKIALRHRDSRFWHVDLEWVEGDGAEARFGVVTVWVFSDRCPATVDMFNAALGTGFAEPAQTVCCCPSDGSTTIQTWLYEVDPRFQLQVTFEKHQQGWLIREARIARPGTWPRPKTAG